MAGTLAEMLVGSVAEQSRKDPGFDQAIGQGAQLAQVIQNGQAQRAQIEQKKQELQMQKAVAVTDTLKIAASSKDKNLKNFLLKKVMPGKIKALGMEEFFSPETMEMIQTSESVQQKVLGLQLDLDNKVREGSITGAEAYQIAQRTLSDPEELAQLDTDRLFAAQEFSKSEIGKSFRTQQQADAAMGKQVQAQQAAGQVAASQGIGKEFADYQTAGGRATLNKNLDKLRDAAKRLKSGEVKTGQVSTIVPGLGGDKAQEVLNPDVAAVRDDIRGAIQASLKQTLGAQFTAQEGEAIFNRAFNPRLSAEENARRVEQEIKGLEETIKNKESEFESRGFKAKKTEKSKSKMNDWSRILASQKSSALTLKGPELQKYIEGFAKKHGITIEEVKKMLGL